MPRPTTTPFLDLLSSCETQSTIELILRDGTPFHFATDFLEIGDVEYQNYLLKVGDLKESGGAATNRVGVEVSNVNQLWSMNLASSLRLLELADVQIKRFYAEEDNRAVFFHKHFFSGKLVGAQTTEKSLTFDVIPKSTAAGLCLANRNLSPLCAFIFRDQRTCKYLGSAVSCNQQLKSRAGCDGRNNRAHNGGFTFPETPTQAAPGGSGGIEIGIGGGSCFLKGTLIFTPRGEQNIENIRKNFRVYSHNPQTREIEIDTVEEVFKHFVSEYFSVFFDDGSVARVTYEHPFLSRSGNWQKVDNMRVGDQFWRFVQGRWKLATIKKIRFHSGEIVEVYNFRVRKNQNYFANRFAVHNTKDNPGGDIPVYQ